VVVVFANRLPNMLARRALGAFSKVFLLVFPYLLYYALSRASSSHRASSGKTLRTWRPTCGGNKRGRFRLDDGHAKSGLLIIRLPAIMSRFPELPEHTMLNVRRQ